MAETESNGDGNRRQSQTKQANQSSINKPVEQPGEGREAKAGGNKKISSTGTGTGTGIIKLRLAMTKRIKGRHHTQFLQSMYLLDEITTYERTTDRPVPLVTPVPNAHLFSMTPLWGL
jgi:hypothetical protein